MKIEDFEKIQASIIEKVGEEKAGLIADDLGILITDNTNVNNTLKEKDEEIKRLTSDKEKLIMTNSSLLQQVGMGEKEKDESYKDAEKENKGIKVINFYDGFDEKGNFKTK